MRYPSRRSRERFGPRESGALAGVFTDDWRLPRWRHALLARWIALPYGSRVSLLCC